MPSTSDIFLGVDHVAGIIEQWQRERPDLDPSPLGVVGRLHRVANRLSEELLAVYAEFDLGEGEFDVLATLRRGGAPYSLTPGELAASTMVTSGAISKRVERCERQGWVIRSTNDRDGRGRVVTLTDAGRDLIDRAYTAHVANEHRLVGLIRESDRRLLADALRRWASALDLS